MATRKTHRARGASWETEITNYARKKGHDAERIARRGSKDEGDVVCKGSFFGNLAIIEAKAPGLDGKIDLPGWLREAHVEADHYAEARGLDRNAILAAVVIKARGKSTGEAYVVLRLDDVIK